jgi:hypothetical protein
MSCDQKRALDPALTLRRSATIRERDALGYAPPFCEPLDMWSSRACSERSAATCSADREMPELMLLAALQMAARIDGPAEGTREWMQANARRLSDDSGEAHRRDGCPGSETARVPQ